MAINRDLFLSILALDSYNRGYNAGVAGLQSVNGTAIGDATIFDSRGDAAAQAAGFYATAYTWNGETIISYRGTDNFGPFESESGVPSDIWNGWSIARRGHGSARKGRACPRSL